MFRRTDGDESGLVVCAIAVLAPRNSPLAVAPRSALRREIDVSLVSIMMKPLILPVLPVLRPPPARASISLKSQYRDVECPLAAYLELQHFAAWPEGNPPVFLAEQGCRICAAIFSFIAGVIPPMSMFERTLLYIRSHCGANAGPLQCRFDVLVDPSVADSCGCIVHRDKAKLTVWLLAV